MAPEADGKRERAIDLLASGEWCTAGSLARCADSEATVLDTLIAELRGWGLAIEGDSASGYRLSQAMELLDADAIAGTIARTASGVRPKRLDVLLATDSTNQRLLDADPEDDPQIVFAEVQTAGRGRRGRAWCSPFGANLYCSLSWSFATWPPQLPALSLAVGVSCAQLLHSIGLTDTRLKWPNDLRVGTAKIGGILIEQRGQLGGPCRVVVGAGINLAMTAAQGGTLDQPWTSVQAELAAKGVPMPARNGLASALALALLDALGRFAESGFAAFTAGWAALDATFGQVVRIEGAGALITGIACGVDHDGALLLESNGVRQPIHSGEVSMRIEPLGLR
jgi:BirA family biotin operon repressor/biotin-[acetyl-CoA-carboxylase] ligase